MKQKSTIFAFFMTAVIAAGSFCAAAAPTAYAVDADLDETVAAMSKDFRYGYSNDPSAISIVGYNGSDAKITIPDAPDGMKIHLDAEFDPVYNVDFSNFSKVTSVTLSKDVSMISMMFMRACSNVKEYMVASGNEDYYSKGGVLYLTDGTIECYPAASDRTSFTVPEGTPGLTQNSFVGCSSLQSLTLPASLKTANCGVSDCPNLKEITFLGTDTEILESFGRRCSSELTIYGYKNSTAERFAADYGFPFIDLNKTESNLQPQKVTQTTSNTETSPTPKSQISQSETKVQSKPDETTKTETSIAHESAKEEIKTETKNESKAESKIEAKTESKAEGKTESADKGTIEENSKPTENQQVSESGNIETTPKSENTGSGAKGGSITTGALETTDSSPSDNNGIIFWVCCAAGVLIVSAIAAIFIVRKRKIK